MATIDRQETSDEDMILQFLMGGDAQQSAEDEILARTKARHGAISEQDIQQLEAVLISMKRLCGIMQQQNRDTFRVPACSKELEPKLTELQNELLSMMNNST